MSTPVDFAVSTDPDIDHTDQDRYQEFRSALMGAGLLINAGEVGLYLRSKQFEDICRGIDAMVSRSCLYEVSGSFHFPLITTREILEKSDYVRSFPNLVGTISSFEGDEHDHADLLAAIDTGDNWVDIFHPTPLALCSAACHPLYQTQTGRMPAGGRVFEIVGTCFRREPSIDPARMQVFRQHEFVYIGEPDDARRHRDAWVELARNLHGRLGLAVEPVVANDPFFGRSGRMLASNQLSAALKVELVSSICSTENPTAITSANCHLDHFGAAFDITTSDGAVAHSACVGFGIERIALALLHTHGLAPTAWPEFVKNELGL